MNFSSCVFGRIGEYHYPSGATYNGEWKNGFRHGSGTYVKADGTSAFGVFKWGQPQGEAAKVLKPPPPPSPPPPTNPLGLPDWAIHRENSKWGKVGDIDIIRAFFYRLVKRAIPIAIAAIIFVIAVIYIAKKCCEPPKSQVSMKSVKTE